MRNVRKSGLACAIIAALALYLPASTAQAGDVLGAHITSLQVFGNSTSSPYLLLVLDQAGGNCQIPFVMSINVGNNKGRAMLSLATAAYLSGKKVNVRGTGSCVTPDGFPYATETFRYLEIYE